MPPAMVTVRVATAAGPVELVRGEQHRGPGGHGVAHERVDEVAAGLVERGVGLVEQPELGAPGDQHGQRGPPALAGRERGDRHVGQPTVEAEAGHGGVGVGRPGSRPARDQKRTLSATVRSS